MRDSPHTRRVPVSLILGGISLALICLGLVVAWIVFFSCTFEPMVITGSRLSAPDETWLRENTTLSVWRHSSEHPHSNYKFLREGTLLLAFYEIRFVHGVDDPTDYVRLHLEHVTVTPRRWRMGAGIAMTVLFEAFIVVVAWRLLTSAIPFERMCGDKKRGRY